MVIAKQTTENIVYEDAPPRHHILHSLAIFDEFAKIKDSMELFPLPGNDVELGFSMPPSPKNKDATSNSNDYGGGMTDLLISFSLKSDLNIQKLNQLIEKGVEEVRHMLLDNEPLWVYDERKRTQVLNDIEYKRRFRELEMTLDDIIKVVVNEDTSLNSSPILGTREIVILSVPPPCIVETMMDARLWSFAFGDMLSRVVVLESLVRGDPTTHDGAIQVMNVEYHGPSPLIPTRQCYIARHCKQLSSNQWMVVDVPLDEVFPNPVTKFKRRPSGCLIEGLDHHRYSKVTWIEHLECMNQDVHPLLKPLVDSGFMFGATRWVNALTRHCKHLEAITKCSSSSSLPNPDVLLRLCARIRRSFYGNLSGSSVHLWKPIPIVGAEDVLLRTCEVPNRDIVALTISVTFGLPYNPEIVFTFLQDDKNRTMWDMIAIGHSVGETLYFDGGLSPDVTISIIEMLNEDSKTVLVQEACYCIDESYIVYAPIASTSMEDEESIVPSGFVIHRGGGGECVVTALFQLFDKKSRLDFVPPNSIQTVCDFVTDTLHAIRNSLSQLSPNNNVVRT